MKLRSGTCLLGSVALVVLVSTPAAAAVEYVKVCSLYGANYFYSPGTDACVTSSGLPGRQQSTFGTISNYSGTDSNLYGLHAFAYGDDSLALGNNAWSGGDPTSASPGAMGGLLSLNGMAPGTSFMNYGTTAVGEGSRAGAGKSGQYNATAVGQSATANALDASAFGQGSNASGNYSTAVGVSSVASGGYSIAAGMSAMAGGDGAVAIGTGAVATGSVAVGHDSSASGGGAAMGDFAAATASKSAAFGYGAGATGANAVAIGSGASATGSNAVAIGAGSVASGANTVSFGTPSNPRRLTNIAPGTGPTDAVNNQQFTTGMADTLAKAENYTDQKISGVGDFERKAFGGIAAAVAMGSASMPSAPGRTTVSVHASQFENYTGGGISVAHRLDTDMPLSVDAGYAHAANEDVGRIGLEVEF